MQVGFDNSVPFELLLFFPGATTKCLIDDLGSSLPTTTRTSFLELDLKTPDYVGDCFQRVVWCSFRGLLWLQRDSVSMPAGLRTVACVDGCCGLVASNSWSATN